MQEPGTAPVHQAGIAESGPYGRMLLATAKWLAFAGGLIFTGLVALLGALLAWRTWVGAMNLREGGEGRRRSQAAGIGQGSADSIRQASCAGRRYYPAAQARTPRA